MKIEVGKSYLTNTKARIRIVCIDRWDNSYPVVGLSLRDGGTRLSGEGVVCLTERGDLGVSSSSVRGEHLVREMLSPWDDIARDTLVWVRHPNTGKWFPRYFWGIAYSEPRMYDSGKTSLTIADGRIPVEKQEGDDFLRNYTTAFDNVSLTKPLEC